jgi:hypothetical protein
MSGFQKTYAAPAPIFEKFSAVNLAQRCTLASAEDRSVIYYLQSIVLAEGGLAGFVTRLKKDFPGAIAIPSLATIGPGADGTFNADQVRILREEIGDSGKFPLKGERSRESILDELLSLDDRGFEFARKPEPSYPTRYHKSEFLECIEDAWGELENALIDFCASAELARTVGRNWWWRNLRKSIADFKSAEAERRRRSVCQTSIGKTVSETLDRCLETGNLVLIDGDARIGKTFAVKQWCALHPGEARYVQTPCTPNEQSFLLAIAEAIGIPSSPRANFGNLRAKIESFARSAKLVIVFDEGHSLLPSTRYTAPARLQWILTALVNHGVGVALVTTPQFLKAQEQIASRTTYNLAQFVGRIFIHAKLPSKLPREELLAVAQHLFPLASSQCVSGIAGYAEMMPSYMQGIGFILDEARCVAKRDERADPDDDDIKAALKTLIGSGTVIAERLQPSRKITALAARRAVTATPAGSVPIDHTRTNFSAPTISAPIQQSVAETAGL